MKVSKKSEQRSFKPPLLMLTILGIHVAAAGFFMMMSGCSTKKPTVEPPPAPVMPPRPVSESAVKPVPRPSFKAPGNVETAPSTIDAANASSYTIQKGDSLSKIAVKAGVSVKEISDLNNIKDPNKIRVGQKILLPSYAKSLPSAPAPAPAKAAAPAKKQAPAGPAVDSGNIHVVVSGDTLGKLAIRYGSSVSAFKSVNNLKSDTIRIGQKLKIPQSSDSSAPAPRQAEPVVSPAPAMPAPAAAAPAAAAPVVIEESVPDTAAAMDDAGTLDFPYTVKKEDTLDAIALKFSVRKDVIMRLNDMTSESITPGQKLMIPWQ